MLISNLSNTGLEHDTDAPPKPPARPGRFADVLGQAMPPFAPWPLAGADIKTPMAPPPSQITQPAERNRQQEKRRERG